MLRFGFISLLLLAYVSCQHAENHSEQVELSQEELEKAKVELGKKLFFDKRLSSDNTVSCATCHIPELAFTDGQKLSGGVDGHFSLRNAPSLMNMRDFNVFMYDAHITNLEEQALVPIHDTNEMNSSFSEILIKLKDEEYYQRQSQLLFNRNFDEWVITRSLSVFQKTLASNNSKFDKYISGQTDVLNEDEIAGWKLFSQTYKCINCHQLPNFTNQQAENNGIYLDYGNDLGRFRIHHDTSDIGKFKVPSLRNIEITAPYMHDGSFKSLNDVIDHYRKGGRGHFNQHSQIVALSISQAQEEQLIAFLKCLTDTSFLKKF